MDGMEEKLNSILGNPQMMQQIMSMAQSLGQSQPEALKQEPPPRQNTGMGMDPAMLQKMLSIAQQSGIDKNQQNLLNALTPYLNRDRIGKLEKAMRAAKIATLAGPMLEGLPFLSGR